MVVLTLVQFLEFHQPFSWVLYKIYHRVCSSRSLVVQFSLFYNVKVHKTLHTHYGNKQSYCWSWSMHICQWSDGIKVALLNFSVKNANIFQWSMQAMLLIANNWRQLAYSVFMLTRNAMRQVSRIMDWAVDTTGLIITSVTCCGQEAQSVSDTSSGRSDTRSCWWMVDQICADPIWPPTPGCVVR